MTSIGIDPQWIGIGALLLLVVGGCWWGLRAYRRRGRRRALLARLERVAFEGVHQVLVPDGMGGFIHILLVLAVIVVVVSLIRGRTSDPLL